LQCQLVRVNTLEKNVIGRMHAGFNPAILRSNINCILECQNSVKNECTVRTSRDDPLSNLVTRSGWLLEREEHRAHKPGRPVVNTTNPFGSTCNCGRTPNSHHEGSVGAAPAHLGPHGKGGPHPPPGPGGEFWVHPSNVLGTDQLAPSSCDVVEHSGPLVHSAGCERAYG
jgi:hypothetical protein